MKGMVEGIEKCASIIRPTYGGAGTNVIVRSKLRPFYQVVNDAETIIQSILIKYNGAQETVLDILKELCGKQDKLAGNGRKTTLILAEELLKGALSLSLTRPELKKLKDELNALIPFIEAQIDNRTKKITVNDVKGVASTASESEETGALLEEIYKQIGAQGILNIEASKTYETSYKITNGVRFEMTGMLSPEMVFDEEAIKENRKETKAVYEKPLILVTKKKISIDDDINPLLREFELMADHRPLVIFTNDMDSTIASQLVVLHKSKQFKILIIKAPTMWQDFVFEDFAKCVGAIIVEDRTGVNFKNLKLEHLGTCDKIEVDQEDTVLMGMQDITEHMKELHAKGDDDSLLRLSWLASKSALLKLGANSQAELSYKRLKANDANRSTYLALQYGVVEGGGVCLYDISKNMPDTIAGKILCEALRGPYRQAVANYGISDEEYEKLITEDIVDASKVVKLAVKNAIGLISMLITAPSIVDFPKKTPEEIQLEIAQARNNPFGN